MKRLLLLIISVISMPLLNAQGIADAVRYSNTEIQGTARFRAMGGAFGALGGDISAISLNPASSAIFNKSNASFSIANYDRDNAVNYFGTSTTNSDSNLEFNQAGGVFVFNNLNSNSPWRKFTLGLAYDQTANLDNDFLAAGTNTRSIDSYFLAYAQGLPLGEISAFEGESYTEAYQDIGNIFGYPHQQAFLGFESFILEPEDINDDNNTNYFSNIAPGDFYQEYSLIAEGYTGKFSINAAIQHNEDVYLGINLNSHFINYREITYLFESNNNPGSLVREVGFENILNVNGSGFSFQLGGIAKLNESLRVGLTYDSPIWYNINEETIQYLATVSEDSNGSFTTIIDPNVVNIFPEYRLQTPAKITASAALVLDKKGLISFDYSRQDFGNAEFRPTADPAFAVQNSIIDNNLKVANNYRVGGELRHNEFSFRAGYRLEDSPYEDESFYGDLTAYSFGIGYSFGNTRLDVAYENSKRDFNEQLYEVGLTDSALINRDNDNITFSLSFGF